MGRTKRTKLVLGEVSSEQGKELSGDSYDTCLRMFLEELEVKNLSDYTKQWYRDNLAAVKKALEELKLPTEPTGITERSIKSCILYWMRERNLSVVTINHKIKAIKQMLKFLNKEGMVDSLVIEEVHKLKGPKTIIKPFEESDIKKLFAQPDRSTFVGFRDYTMMLVFLDTGVRLIEMENMMLSNVCISQNKILVLGKGSKEREVIFQTKTREFLQRYITIRGNLDHDYLWIGNQDQPINRRNIQERLALYGSMAGIEHVRCSPHTFRHTCAKQYIRNGGDVLSLQKLLGHSSLEMVRHYVNLWGTDLREMHRRFSPVENLFGTE